MSNNYARKLLLNNPIEPSEERPSLDGFEYVDRLTGIGAPISFLPGLDSINVVVGSNNSGKSRLMRQLFSQNWIELEETSARRVEALFEWHSQAVSISSGWSPDLSQPLLRTHLLALMSQIERMKQTPLDALDRLPTEGTGLLLSNSIELWLAKVVLDAFDDTENAESKLFNDLLVAIKRPLDTFKGGAGRAPQQIDDRYIELAEVSWRSQTGWRAYCPPTRTTLRIADAYKNETPIDLTTSSIQIDPIASAYAHSYGWNPEQLSWMTIANPNVSTGQRLYEQVQSANSGSREIRERWESKTKLILNELLGLRGDLRLIPSTHRNHSHDRNLSPIQHLRIAAHDRDYSLHDLGDGVSACLIVLLPLLLAPETKGMFFVEEPETHLHPVLQRKLIELLCRTEIRGNKQICLTTHSPTILDAIWQYAPKESTVIRVDRIESQTGSARHVVTFANFPTIEILEALGAGANALLARSLLLVEGPSDVRYVNALISLLSDQYRLVEGRDYVIVSYGGSLLDDLLTRGDEELAKTLPGLGHYCFVLADQDMGKENKHTKNRELFETTAGRFLYETTGNAVEVENLFPKEIWERVLPQVHSKKWGDAKQAFPPPDIMLSKRLGSIAEYVFQERPLPTNGAGETMGTSEKTTAARIFAEMVTSGKITKDDIGIEAQKLATRICQFIEKARNLGEGV